MSQERIFIVDDNEYNRQLLEATLYSEGYEVHQASDGQEALDRLDEVAPDLIMLDINMPVLDGLETCRRIRSQPEHNLLPIVILTAETDMKTHLSSIEAGANDFVTKPFIPAIILARAQSLIQVKKLTDEMENAQQAFVAMVRAVEAKDAYTHGHSERVAIFTSRLAAAAGLSEDDQDRLLQAGMLHDLGKIALKESILHKPSKLTDEEFDHIRTHPVIGEEILKDLKFAQKLLPAVRHHHENFTGGGYPDGIAGEEIPQDARLMAVADAYDAMTSNRPYRDGISSKQALNILKEDKLGQWQPEFVESFVALF